MRSRAAEVSQSQGGTMQASQDTGGDNQDDAAALRHVASFFEKFERYELQELLATAQTNYMLSTDDLKIPTDPPSGLITNMISIGNTYCAVVLFPEDPTLPTLDMREVHQIVRELTFGIFGMNQMPSVYLEANCDESTSCQVPPAYIDTRVGQILISVDYIMKSMWHGAYFPKDKRTKFLERWRSNMDVNHKKPLLTEFTSAGKLPISLAIILRNKDIIVTFSLLI